MATLKIKFRPSTKDDEQGMIFYQVIHKRVARQQKTGYRLHKTEWNSHTSQIRHTEGNNERKYYLSTIKEKIQTDARLINRIIESLEQKGKDYSADDVISRFANNKSDDFLFVFAETVIESQRQLGKIRTSETYSTTINSFRKFRKDLDIALEEIDSEVISAYESYLKQTGIRSNTSSFYMRNLRALYNRAVEKNLTVQRFPFKHVYTGVDKTVKRAVSLKTIRQIKHLDLSHNPSLDFARDMFLFSFYTRGMAFVDMAYLKKKDLNGKILSYRRRKTGQLLFIKWEGCMQDIVKKYDTSDSENLLPIIKAPCLMDERKQYLYAAHNVNQGLKSIGMQLELEAPLTMYVARHAWASIARSKNVPISVISEGLGHDSETTTRIYLASLDTVAIDKANSKILNSL